LQTTKITLLSLSRLRDGEHDVILNSVSDAVVHNWARPTVTISHDVRA